MTIQERVRAFVLDNYYVSDPASLADSDSLLETGVVDSTGMLEIILYIEAEFGIAVGDRDTTPQNLETISRIAAFVERKLEGRGVDPGGFSAS
jgi:acyl carrier protein